MQYFMQQKFKKLHSNAKMQYVLDGITTSRSWAAPASRLAAAAKTGFPIKSDAFQFDNTFQCYGRRLALAEQPMMASLAFDPDAQ